MNVRRVAVRVRGLRVEAVTALVSGALLASPALPQVAAPQQASSPALPPKADAPSAAPVPVEQFQEPRVKYVDDTDYPREEIEEGGEGWVTLGFMVDPKGKPFEITVLASAGNKKFEQAAVRTLERCMRTLTTDWPATGMRSSGERSRNNLLV
jgi:TonB family protein